LARPALEGEESAWRLGRRRLWLRGCPERAGGAVLNLAIPGAALAAVAIWGATPIATKIAVVDIAPLTAGMLRTGLAALLTAPLLMAYRMRPPARSHQRALLGLVIAGSLIAFPVLFSLGVGRTSAAHAGLILAALPLPTGLFGALFERRLPPPAWWLGAAIALCGEALLIGLDAQADAQVATWAGDLLVALAALCGAAGHVAGARLAPAFGTWPTTLWAVTIAGVMLAPVLALRSGDVAGAGAAAWIAVLFLAGGSTLLAFAAWYWSLSRGGIARMGAMQFLQPLVTLGLAALMLGEPVTGPLLGATALILVGVALTQRRRRRWRQESTTPSAAARQRRS
jgi:drug/metabolite transporter (DMT)-like permease